MKMRNNVISAAITLLFLLPFSVFGQESNLGNWLIYIGKKNIDQKWSVHHEIQYRNYDALGDLEQLLLRTGIGYDLTEGNNNVLLGYGFVHSQNYVGQTEEKVKVDEHRIFQQFITRQKVGTIGLQHRYRFEQRFVADDFKLRFRYFLGLTIPLIQKNESDRTVYLSSYNEIFLNTKSNVFDRNRLYGGIGSKLTKNLRMEIGYMNQFLANGNRDQLNVVCFFSF